MIGHYPFLYNSEKNFTLLWNAKSVSAVITSWFFYHLGKYNEIEEKKLFSHSFRTSFEKETNLRNVISLNTILKSNIVCAVKNPYDRVVSMYKHTITFDFANKEISKILKRNIDSENKFSFNEFIYFLERIDINNVNVHFFPQSRNFLQNHKDYLIIKAENFFESVKEVENKLNLETSPIEKFSTDLTHHNKKVNYTDSDFCFDIKFKKTLEFPQNHLFLNDDLKNRIRKIYYDDFIQFNYE